MYSDEQIRSAMQDLVLRKGEDHTSYGRYASYEDINVGACFVGALCEQMGVQIPKEGSRAPNAFGVGAVSERMGQALTIAQYLNDQTMEWKYVLMGVDLVLEGGVRKISREDTGMKCPCGCMSPEFKYDYQTVIDKVTTQRAYDRTKVVVPKIKADLKTLDQQIISLSGAITSFQSAFAEFSYIGVTKKEHALVA